MYKIYENIKSKREALKMSQEELAIKAGYKERSSISKIEKGETDLPLSKVFVFANIFNIDPGELLGWEYTPTIPDYIESENILIFDYRQLNPEGQEEIQKHMKYIYSQSKYKKCGEDELGDKSPCRTIG